MMHSKINKENEENKKRISEMSQQFNFNKINNEGQAFTDNDEQPNINNDEV